MIRKTRLFTPGPTPLLPAAQFAMAAADLHHRTPEFRALYVRVLEQLRTFIGTKNDVILMACSGSGVMEASVANITSPGDRVLVLSAGKFGERWTGIAKAYNCDVDLVSVPYGQTFSLDAVKAALKVETRAVYMQANESSTGTRHDVEGVAKLLKRREERRGAGGGCHHRAGHDALRCGWVGCGHHDRRLAEGGDDSARPGLLLGEREGVGADGQRAESALLLRSAQGAEERGEGRVVLHAGNFADCGADDSAGLHRVPGRWRPGSRAREAGG